RQSRAIGCNSVCDDWARCDSRSPCMAAGTGRRASEYSRPSHRSRRRIRIRSMTRDHLRVIATCSAALFVPLLVPLGTGRVFTKDDLGAMHLPFRYLYREALHHGDSILWTPALLSGFFLHGEGEAGMTHPFHFVLYRTLPLGPAFNLEIITSYVAMF